MKCCVKWESGSAGGSIRYAIRAWRPEEKGGTNSCFRIENKMESGVENWNLENQQVRRTKNGDVPKGSPQHHIIFCCDDMTHPLGICLSIGQSRFFT